MKKPSVRRKSSLNLFRDKANYSSYGEAPLLREDAEPQVHASLNSVDQPFYLICQKDTVLASVSGKAQVRFQDASVRYFDLEPGDFVYVPGGVAHRIACSEDSLHLRYKARIAGLEAIAWFCGECQHEVDRYTWDTANESIQSGYLRGTTRFNESAARRTCPDCGTLHPEVDLQPFQWKQMMEDA
jgi:hypothetical protein